MQRTLFISLGMLAAGGLYAQEVSPVTFSLGAGFTEPIGTQGRYTDVGWNLQGGVGFNFNSHIGAMIDANYNSMGINSTTLGNLGTSGGNVNVVSFTLDPILHVHQKGRVDMYLIGGGGLYHRWDDLTNPGSGGFLPGGFGFFGNQVVSSYSINKPGFDAGAGFSVGTKWHGKFFAEARYNRMFTSPSPTDFIPVTFGFRW